MIKIYVNMTKFKFYTIKTLVAIGLSAFIYFCIDLLEKNQITDGRKPSELEFGILFFLVVVAFIIFLIGIEYLLHYQRPKFTEEIEEEKKNKKRKKRLY